MENDTSRHFSDLAELNEALVAGLEAAVYLMENWDSHTPQGRLSIIAALQDLIYRSKNGYGTTQTKH